MSLLGDLRLDFETLADDPIDMGIYYGKSVLQVFSDRVVQPLRTTMDEMVAPVQLNTVLATPEKTVQPQVRTAIPRSTYTPRTTSFDRRNFRRDFEPVVTRTYSQRRDMVGSL